MLPARFQDNENVSKISKLHQHIQKADYKKFWSEIKSDLTGYNSIIPNFEDKMKKVILKKLSVVFSTLKKEKLIEFLNEQNLSKILPKEYEISGDFVIFPESKQTISKPKETEKISHLESGHIKPLLRQLIR